MLMKCYEVVGKRYKPPLASLKIITNFALGNDTTSSLKRFFKQIWNRHINLTLSTMCKKIMAVREDSHYFI